MQVNDRTRDVYGSHLICKHDETLQDDPPLFRFYQFNLSSPLTDSQRNKHNLMYQTSVYNNTTWLDSIQFYRKVVNFAEFESKFWKSIIVPGCRSRPRPGFVS